MARRKSNLGKLFGFEIFQGAITRLLRLPERTEPGKSYPMPTGGSRCPRMRDPSAGGSAWAFAARRAAVRVQRVRREPVPPSGRTRWRAEHPRQPDECWLSIRRAILRWTAVGSFKSAGPIGMDCHGRAVEAHGFDPDADEPLALLFLAQAIQHARLGPPLHLGRPRHAQPCSATYRMALTTCRLDMLTFPRRTGSNGSIRLYCATLISMPRWCRSVLTGSSCSVPVRRPRRAASR